MRAIARAASIFVLGTGVLLGGCATKESVEHAQLTADSAKAAAAGARSAADRAQSSADGAGKTAQDAMTLAQQANDKADKLIAQLEERKHERTRHHRRHTASAAASAACPPQQKTELRPNKPDHRQAASPTHKTKHKVRYTSLPEKTARN